jgi:uncharacterized protein YegL
VPRISEFTVDEPRPLPVIILADVSGSMGDDGKIDALNHAVAEMVKSFALETPGQAIIQVAVITFGEGGARMHTPLANAADVKWTPMRASGQTPLGAAIEIARQLVEDRRAIPGRAYRPVIVLLSDGEPNDEWVRPLEALRASSRAAKADRFALGVGAGAGMATLDAFLADPSKRVLLAEDARQLKNFFRWLTMSVTVRSKSATPDADPPPAPLNFDEAPY